MTNTAKLTLATILLLIVATGIGWLFQSGKLGENKPSRESELTNAELASVPPGVVAEIDIPDSVMHLDMYLEYQMRIEPLDPPNDNTYRYRITDVLTDQPGIAWRMYPATDPELNNIHVTFWSEEGTLKTCASTGGNSREVMKFETPENLEGVVFSLHLKPSQGGGTKVSLTIE
ncbi:MAG: hypothetical protein KDN22_17770 [Verrucomicrobiae bacterium]|nr:hypothetical protein [Verrucomicrobiae bacterium]